jgi:predicted RNase H-like HicB family nuclease
VNKLEEQVQEMVGRDWTVLIHRGEDGYLATVTELPGCVTAGESWAELDGMIKEAIAAWIESALEHGDPIHRRAHEFAATRGASSCGQRRACTGRSPVGQPARA